MRAILLSVLTLSAVTLTAQTATFTTSAKDEIAANHYLAGSNYLDYDRQLPTTPLTPTPKGYEPYYMSHYGRHGSRWLIGEGDYRHPLTTLREARDEGKLTAIGMETLKKLEDFYPTTVKRLGDLTTVGERQHHGIGRRMVEHFPELFKRKNLPIDARSTVVIRCILSMVAECEELMAANPTARIHNDVSESLQYYLNQPWEGRVRDLGRRTGDRESRDARLRYTHPERLMKLLFNDEQYVYNNVRAGEFMLQLFEVAANMQSHDTDIELLSLFTDDELYDQWRIRNVGWYLDYAAAPQPQPQATLRFGHEVCVMPLACLLELDNCGAQVENLDTLDRVWRNYRIFPMGCNIQLVFYRPKKGKQGDILVKALLNERETTLPVTPVQWPYYRWQDVRQYYQEKIRQFETEGK